MTDTDLRNSAALAEFSNWAASFSDAVQQSLQPFSEAAAYVAAHDCATGLRRRRAHAAYCQVRIQGTGALSRKLDAVKQYQTSRQALNSQQQRKHERQIDTSLRPLRRAAAVGTCAAVSPPVFTGSQLAQILRRNERPPATQ
jgi:hypothetical protein